MPISIYKQFYIHLVIIS